MKIKFLFISWIFFSLGFSQEIISLTPDAGVQGENNIEVTLVAGGVNFYDPYSSIEEIYFSGEGLSTANYQVTSDTTINFELTY